MNPFDPKWLGFVIYLGLYLLRMLQFNSKRSRDENVGLLIAVSDVMFCEKKSYQNLVVVGGQLFITIGPKSFSIRF